MNLKKQTAIINVISTLQWVHYIISL